MRARCQHDWRRTEVWSVAWTYAFCNRPIACRTGQVAKGNVRMSQRYPPRPRACIANTSCGAVCSVRSCSYPLWEASACALCIELCTYRRSVECSGAFLAGLCRSTGACPPVKRPQRGEQRPATALPGTSIGVVSDSDGAAVAARGKAGRVEAGKALNLPKYMLRYRYNSTILGEVRSSPARRLRRCHPSRA